MTSSLRFVFGVWLLLVASIASAQGGIRLILWNYEPVLDDPAGESHFGVGYDADLNDRVSCGIGYRTTLGQTGGWAINYRSAYHFSDNTDASFYFGPTVGVRKVDDRERTTLFPVGFRMGVRGGLERFYADLYVGGHYNLGAGDPVLYERTLYPQDILRTSFCAGLDLGWGWEGRSSGSRR